LEVSLTSTIAEVQTGGRCEIRTHEELAPLPVFKTGAFNRSANLPDSNFDGLHGADFTIWSPSGLKSAAEWEQSTDAYPLSLNYALLPPKYLFAIGI
jgi:hypothetical protein